MKTSESELRIMSSCHGFFGLALLRRYFQTQHASVLPAKKEIENKAKGRCSESCGHVWEATRFEPLTKSLRFSQCVKYNLGKCLWNSQNWRWESLGEPCEVSVVECRTWPGFPCSALSCQAGPVTISVEHTCAHDTSIPGSQLAWRHICGSMYNMYLHDNKDTV